jgi:TonB-dependent receptor
MLSWIKLTTILLLFAAPTSGQSDDLVGGLMSPGLNFLPRKVREQMIYEVPWLAGEWAETRWRVALEERDFQREGASGLTLGAAQLYEVRVGELVNLKTRTYEDVDSEWVDFKNQAQWNSLLNHDLGHDSRGRFRWEFPDPEEGGIVFYYRHRERYEGREQERTKWGRANNVEEGRDVSFIDEHELRFSPERQVMDEVGFNLNWWLTPKTLLDFSTVYRTGEDTLKEQRIEYDSRSGTQGLPGAPAQRGYRYDPKTDVIEDGIITEATSIRDRSRVERQLKDEIEEKRRYAFQGSLRHELSERAWMKFDSEYAFKETREPDRQDTEYAEEDTAVFSYVLDGRRPIFTLDRLPTDVFGLRKVEFEDNIKRRWLQSHRVALHHEVRRGLEFEVGGFWRAERDFRDVDYRRFEPTNSPAQSGFDSEILGSGTSSVDGILIGPNLDPGLARGIDLGPLIPTSAENIYKTAREDYDARREVMGTWLQYRWEPNLQWRVHAGARLEYEREKHQATEAFWNGSENFGNFIFPANPVATNEVHAKKTSRNVLPSLLIEYQPEEEQYYSLQVRQSLQRARLWELAPIFAADEDKGTAPRVVMGNPDLDPSRQTQLSLVRDHAFAPGSFLRLSMEYWHLEDPLTRASWFQPYRIDQPGVTNTGLRNYRFEQTIAGRKGSLGRLGAHYAQQLSFLPYPLDQVSVFGSYSYTISEQEVSVDGNRRDTNLTYQPEHRALLGVFLRSPKWRARVFANFNSDYLVRVGESENATAGAGDLSVQARITMDAALEYRLNERWEFFMEGRNLLNTPLEITEGSDERRTHWERQGASVRLGFQAFF